MRATNVYLDSKVRVFCLTRLVGALQILDTIFTHNVPASSANNVWYL